MKKIVFTLIVLIVGTTFLQSQNPNIPLNQIQEIANRNAVALWGNVFPDDPIPYYSAQDEIIAYMFNYSIEKPYPKETAVIEQCKAHKHNNNRSLQWGGDNYGRILMGANENLPPIIEYSKSLSAKYAEGYKLQELASKELGSSFSLQKIYYINGANQWFCYTNGIKTIYIKLFPPIKVLDKTSFENAIEGKNVFIQPADYSVDWELYKSGEEIDSKAASYIPDYELCRFYDWSYGCSPTAAAMLFSWWDYRSIYSNNDFGRLIQYYYKRFDPLEAGGEWDYQIPWVQRELAIYMDTDTLTGFTGFFDLNDGIEDVASIRGYEFDSDDYITFEWTRLKGEIDDNRPLIASIPNHSTCCVGYNNSSNHFANHYTHEGNMVWTHKDELDGVVEVKPENNNGQGITLTYPVGDTNYNATGNGEIFYPGEEYNITWDYETSITSTTTIYWNTNSNGGFVEEIIVSNTANDGLYPWIVPAGFGSDECRVGLINYNASSEILAMDGSQGMFTIYDPPEIVELGSYDTETTDYNPDYFQFDLNEDAWCAVGVRNMTNSEWKLKLYDNLTYLILIAESNMPPEISEVDFVVLDGNHLPDHTYGVKVDRLDGDDAGKIRYEGVNSTLVLGTNTINFSQYSVLKMYDVHLVTGYYTFTATSGSGEASIALFNSSGGDNIQILDDAMAQSNLGGWGESETFTVCITTEDDYGFCIWTSSPSSQTWEVEIIEEHPGIWEGDSNTNWHNSNNWSLNIVPSFGTNVIIPAGTPYNPYISSAAFCGNITIESGASLRVSSSYLVADGDMLIKGNLRIYEDEHVTVNEDITWTSTSSVYMENNSSINIGEDWTFDYGCSIQMNVGKVRFAGIEHSMIYCRSVNSWFNDVEVDKLIGTALVSYEMTPGLQPLRIHGDFNGTAGRFFCPSWDDVFFKGEYFNMEDDFIFYCTNGSFIFSRTSSQYLHFNSNSYFNNLVIELSGNVNMYDPIVIEQNLIINSGVLASNSHKIEIGGSWRNNVGIGAFWQSSGTVVFTGYGNRECDGEEFHILELNKTSGELRFHEGVTECDSYNYTQGVMRVNGGSFTANDLEDSGIYGEIIVTSGNLTFHQDASQYIDLRGDLTITDGTFTIYGGGDNSYWPYQNNASITMSGGILDIVDNGIRIHSTNYLLTENITGGRIRTAYGFDIYRDDFTPTGGAIELYGTSDEHIILAGGSNFYDLEINKSTKNYSPNSIIKKPRYKEPHNPGKSNSITANSNLDINGDFIIQAGTFDAPGKMFVAGDWQNFAGPAAFIEDLDTVYFDGNSDQYCNYENFYNLVLVKSGGELILNDDDVFCENYDWASGDLHVDGGGFIVSDLVDDGIYGTTTLSAGLIEFTQGTTTGEYVDLNGSLTINGGQMNVFGGSIASYWPWAADASITMSGGVLDFKDQGIYIFNSPTWALTENIIGGTIRTSSDFNGDRTDFTPTGGTLELYGPDDAVISMGAGSSLFNLDIYKSGKGSQNNIVVSETRSGQISDFKSQKSNTVTMVSDVVISGDFSLQESSFEFNGLQGKFTNDLFITDNSIMILNDNSELALGSGSNISFENGSVFEAIGSSGIEVKIFAETGYFNFTIGTGGTIRADYAIFENMGVDGIYINSGGLVDVAFPFNNCTFQNGIGTSASSLLKIDNNQVLTISNTSFPVMAGGGACNVAKTLNTGNLTFTDFAGSFSGETFDDDVFNLIYWDGGSRELELTLFLEGPYNGTDMNADLTALSVFPLLQPYNEPPWNYTGSESVGSITNPNTVDWVLIEYRDAPDAVSAVTATIIGRQVAFLLNDGSVVGLDEMSNLQFPYTINDKLFIVVHHRNHLGVLSAYPLTESTGIYTFDFTTPGGQAYGTNAQKNLGSGIYGLYGGDGNANGTVNTDDKSTVWSIEAGSNGYLNSDFNMDSQTDNQDKNDIWTENNETSSQVPD